MTGQLPQAATPLQLSFLAHALQRQVWAITDAGLASVQDAARAGLDEPLRSPDAAASAPVTQQARNGKQVAIVNLHGVIVDRAPAWAESYGYINPRSFASTIRDLADNATITAICIWADSPGGTVSGTIEAGEAVAYARTKKPIVLVASDMACSGAYWLASQCSQVVASPTALVGSIGVITSHTDISGFYQQLGVVVTFIRSAAKKALGQATEPLSEEARAERQGLVDSIHGQFVAAVAKGRRKARDLVAKNWATGQVWVGQDAVTVGIADRVATLGTILAELTGNATPPAPPEQIPADEGDDPDDDRDAQASGDPAADLPAPHAEQPPEGGAHIQEDPMNVAAITAKLKKGEQLSAEEQSFLAAHLDGHSAASAAQASPPLDLSALAPEVRERIEAAEARATAAETTAAGAQSTADRERHSRLEREFGDRAEALGHPRAFGATLRAASEGFGDSEAGRTQYQALEARLNATGAQQALTGERGSSRDNRQQGNVYAEMSSRVEAVLKEHPGLTKVQAGEKVLKDDPVFAKRYASGR